MLGKYIKKLVGEEFVQPIRKYYWGPLMYGTPYFWPMGFNSSIISVRKLELNSQEVLDKCPNDWVRASKKFKNMPMVRRSNNCVIKLFKTYWYITIGWPIMFKTTKLGWKDKFNSPRYEWSPSFIIFLFGWQFCMHWVAPNNDDDRYWEMLLWCNEYCDKDLEKARSTWGWTDYETKKSTWNEDYIKK